MTYFTDSGKSGFSSLSAADQSCAIRLSCHACVKAMYLNEAMLLSPSLESQWENNRVAAEYSELFLQMKETSDMPTYLVFLIEDVLMSLTLGLFLNIMCHSIHQCTLITCCLQLQKSFALVTREEPELCQMTVHQSFIISCC